MEFEHFRRLERRTEQKPPGFVELTSTSITRDGQQGSSALVALLALLLLNGNSGNTTWAYTRTLSVYVVGVRGFEPPTSASRTRRASPALHTVVDRGSIEAGTNAPHLQPSPSPLPTPSEDPSTDVGTSIELLGALCRSRTDDLLVTRETLFHLS